MAEDNCPLCDGPLVCICGQNVEGHSHNSGCPGPLQVGCPDCMMADHELYARADWEKAKHKIQYEVLERLSGDLDARSISSAILAALETYHLNLENPK